MIVLDGLEKRFNEVHAVAGVSLEAPDGRVTGLVGPNGAGKSTTLRLLYGAQRPDAGRALVDGIDVAEARERALARLGGHVVMAVRNPDKGERARRAVAEASGRQPELALDRHPDVLPDHRPRHASPDPEGAIDAASIGCKGVVSKKKPTLSAPRSMNWCEPTDCGAP